MNNEELENLAYKQMDELAAKIAAGLGVPPKNVRCTPSYNYDEKYTPPDNVSIIFADGTVLEVSSNSSHWPGAPESTLDWLSLTVIAPNGERIT